MEKNSEKIVAMLCRHLNKKTEDVTPGKRIKEDLGADSLDLVDLIMTIEDEYGISIPEESVAGISTVKDLIDFVENFKQ